MGLPFFDAPMAFWGTFRISSLLDITVCRFLEVWVWIEGKPVCPHQFVAIWGKWIVCFSWRIAVTSENEFLHNSCQVKANTTKFNYKLWMLIKGNKLVIVHCIFSHLFYVTLPCLSLLCFTFTKVNLILTVCISLWTWYSPAWKAGISHPCSLKACNVEIDTKDTTSCVFGQTD